MIFGEGMENYLCYPRDRGGGLGVDVCAGEHTVKRNTIHEAWRKGVSVTIPYQQSSEAALGRKKVGVQGI